jgi:adenylate cyclase
MLPAMPHRAAPLLVRKILAALTIIGLSLLIVGACRALLNLAPADDLFYDIAYRTRAPEDRTHGDIVIIAADQASLDAIDKTYNYGWPWPRDVWGRLASYAANAGAKAIVFDLTYSETSVYEQYLDDDTTFAAALDAIHQPLIMGAKVDRTGAFERFALPMKHPVFGAVNIGNDKIFRRYEPFVHDQPSLAAAVAQALHPGAPVGRRPFLLHFYGPTRRPDGGTTYPYLEVHKVLTAQMLLTEPTKKTPPEDIARITGITPNLFKDKIVLFGAVASGTYDLKSTPLSTEYPGVEVQATAIDNILFQQRVRPAPLGWRILTLLAALALAAIGVILPRAAGTKLLGPALAIAGVLALSIGFFHADPIRWLTPVDGLLGLLIVTPSAFAYTYFAEDRQRRFMLKALSKVVAPAIAEQLAREPQRLQLGTVRNTLTMVFTDLANFTDLAEAMDVEELGRMLNRYLGAMSDAVLASEGTLDKYIGDAVMAFWNAPLPQADHARRACRAALAMAAAEEQIRAELGPFGQRLFTRIGINTASVAVGFVGSSHLFNYTALGDGVNLASRLEGANKIYGTRIMLSETTAQLVADEFLLRKLDLLRVKGKKVPMAVYQLLAERAAATPDQTALATLYESALAAYQKQRWDDAARLLLELCEKFGEDAPSRQLLHRIELFRAAPPPSDWDGVMIAKDK